MSTVPAVKAEIYSLQTPYMLAGITTSIKASTDMLRVTVKVYAEGGENFLHHHLHEDHSFIVIEGEATFYFEEDGEPHVVRPYEGVMLPAGADYRFQSTGDTNLVMIRVGAFEQGVKSGAFYPSGEPKIREHAKLAGYERIEAPGPGFGAPVS